MPVSAYSFAASLGTYIQLLCGATRSRDTQQDDDKARSLFIGFAFVFASQAYTRFVVDSNG